ncbi:hypothetical protein AVEN_189255-1 [Araneus ventricosus]|uniref:DUF4817 domain-containing protein n=1 Tax=Araneus ventricosus TaxID=182803 RepID=A0A4Y2N067_ARAVE|nr:hypothetical protein AVEN_9523-1 [Araneus ventricosus]GBN31887.1 hypothetical protein AVEN_78437-1 [Araneus ventricosus]GBN32145.1 hypothetical protein AVEN_189905-1 [Araneus ventricosus]GBN32242.1 hypothetical protein AVEN_189255-1 [Araneus ventricosus]
MALILSTLLAHPTTTMPCCTRALHTAAPMPTDAPVTRATRPFQRSISNVYRYVFYSTINDAPVFQERFAQVSRAEDKKSVIKQSKANWRFRDRGGKRKTLGIYL